MNCTTETIKMKVCSKCKNEKPATTDYYGVFNRAKDGLQARCKECRKEERLDLSQKEYKSKYYRENKDKHKTLMENVRKKNEKTYREVMKVYYEENKDRILKRNKEYKAKNKEKDRMYKHRYEARKRKLTNDYDEKTWVECKNTFDNRCAYCGEKSKLTYEHFIPVSKGGEYTRKNIIPACSSCNKSKNNTDFKKWYYEKPFYDKERENKILRYLGYELKDEQIQN